ncbi:MAG: capsule assembly Wzi family protein, partial [Glaciecola sp.]
MKYKLLSLMVGMCCASYAQASAYIGTQDKQLHIDLQTLVEYGYINVAVNTYPLPWKGIVSGLDSINARNMAQRPQQAYLRLRHYLQLNKQQKSRRFTEIQLASDDQARRSFDDGVNAKGQLSFTTEFYAGRWSGQVRVNHTSSSSTTDTSRFDESFIAYQFGDWNIRAGALEQWWGPSIGTSVSLSNDSQPLTTLALSRSTNTASEHELLRWLGPWFFTAQIGAIDGSASAPKAKVTTNRLNFRPDHNLEVGVSYTALFDQNNHSQAMLNAQEVYNLQLKSSVGLDIAYTQQFDNRPVTAYAQHIEQTLNTSSDSSHLMGLSTYINDTKVFVEAASMTGLCGLMAAVNNCMFENGNTEYMGSAATNLAAENSVSTGILANNKLVTIGA